MATYQELLAQKSALETRLAELRATEIKSVIEKIHNLMTEYGLTIDDLAPKRGRGRPKGVDSIKSAPLPPKYRHPKTGQTWSGRGRAPAWLGAKRERFLIGDNEE